MSFAENGYEVIRNALGYDLVKYIQILTEVHEKSSLHQKPPTKDNPYPFADIQTAESFSWYASFQSEALMVYLKPTIEKVVKKELLETYSYYRVYYKNAELKFHLDRDTCEYSSTVCIEKTHMWPISFETHNKENVSIELNPGDLIVYKGAELPHWRNKFIGDRHVQLFIHYVDKNGPFSQEHLDGRDSLGLSFTKK